MNLLSVNIGRVRAIGMFEGRTARSGIDKKPVAADEVFVRALGIEGDEQADLTVHGGADKAVYAYPSDHWAWWSAEKNLPCAPATFGENLTLQGADEDDVAIGDRFRWGDVVLEVSQPRAPCYKLGMHTSRPDLPQALALSARSGWYYRVIAQGRAPSRDARIERISASGGPSVRDAFRALFDSRGDETLLRRVHDMPQLAHAWRRPLAAKIAHLRVRRAES